MTIIELIDTMIVDCNDAVGAVAKGEYVKWCRLMYELVQKLAIAKSTIMQGDKPENAEKQGESGAETASEDKGEEVPAENQKG